MAQKPTLWRFSALGGRAGVRGSPQRALVVLRQACRSHDLLNGDHEPIRIPACQHAADPCAGLFAEAAQADGLRRPWLRTHGPPSARLHCPSRQAPRRTHYNARAAAGRPAAAGFGLAAKPWYGLPNAMLIQGCFRLRRCDHAEFFRWQ